MHYSDWERNSHARAERLMREKKEEREAEEMQQAHAEGRSYYNPLSPT